MVDLFAPFIIGFLGSFHCLGMCGPLVVAYSLHLKSPSCPETRMRPLWQTGVLHHLAFQAGRLLTYGFLGFAAAGLVHLMDLKQIFSNHAWRVLPSLEESSWLLRVSVSFESSLFLPFFIPFLEFIVLIQPLVLISLSDSQSDLKNDARSLDRIFALHALLGHGPQGRNDR